MADDLEFCLLRPLIVRSGGAVVPIRQAKQRVPLVTLLLAANRVVPVDALGEAGRTRISSQPGGYSMQASPGELDVRRFEVLLGAAREAVKWLVGHVAEQASADLLLWPGEALADIDSDLLRQREVSRLAEMRLYANAA